MAPEYAMRGYLTDKADVYSFGIVVLEIVSGRSNTNYRPKEERTYLLDWVTRICFIVSLFHHNCKSIFMEICTHPILACTTRKLYLSWLKMFM